LSGAVTGAGPTNDGPLFSLILCTINRTQEVAEFLDSLDAQTYRSFELIVVDQNADDRLQSLLAHYASRFPIKHIRSPKGLSRARNAGLKLVSGHVVAFPDDDCCYFPETLRRVVDHLHDHPHWDGITGRPVDPSSPNGYSWYDRTSGSVTKQRSWFQATSFTIFLRSMVVARVGDFDENLGVGAESGRISAEEVDYVIRAVDEGMKIFFDADLTVQHPAPIRAYDEALIRRGYGYSLGLGHVLRKHHFPISTVARFIIRPVGGSLLSLLSGNINRARYHCAVAKGRILGWIGD
jgi:glycosyltransferase involved in cell wall biosynthesis